MSQARSSWDLGLELGLHRIPSFSLAEDSEEKQRQRSSTRQLQERAPTAGGGPAGTHLVLALRPPWHNSRGFPDAGVRAAEKLPGKIPRARPQTLPR